MLNPPLNPDVFKWPFNGMLSDLRVAISGKANLLTALGLLIYTEVLGREILKARGIKKPKSEKAFYCFAEEYMGMSKADKIYEHYRNGLAHLHDIIGADSATVRMRDDPNWIPGDSLKAIHAPKGGKIREFRVNAYWRDFQCGLAKAADEYPKRFFI
jgi:hypothetical protein